MPAADDDDPDVIGTAPRFAETPPATGDPAYPAKADPAYPARDRKRRVVIAGAVGAVLVVAAVSVFAGLGLGAASGTASVNPALIRLITQVTSVPESVLDAHMPEVPGLGVAGPVPAPSPVTGAPLVQHGKPEVFYVAAEYCPYCGAENWALIVALSHFGTFSGLSTIRSAAYPPFPPLDTWAFDGSRYASGYLAFVPVETRSNILVSRNANPHNGINYRELQKLTSAQQAVFDADDTSHAVPFVDFGNRVVLVGASVSPALLEQLTWNQIAASLRHPDDPVGQAILSAASTITAAICQLTGNRPASACPPAIRSLEVGL